MALFALAWSQDVGIRVLSVEMQLERQEADQEYLGVSTLNKMFTRCFHSVFFLCGPNLQ